MWEPDETMAITMLSPNKLIEESFYDSAVWHKLSRLILAGIVYENNNPENAKIVRINPIDVSDPELIRELKSFWEMIKNIIITGNISKYSSKGTSNGFIQLRTKGPGNGKGMTSCPITGKCFNSRAFYATKSFLRYALGIIR